MGLTQIFLIVGFASIVLAAGFAALAVGASDSEMPVVAFVSGIISAVCVVAIFVGFIGTFWSFNTNSRETRNRCTESGGYVYSIAGANQCLAEPPQILWKL